jgi:hypothetical protein
VLSAGDLLQDATRYYFNYLNILRSVTYMYAVTRSFVANDCTSCDAALVIAC